MPICRCTHEAYPPNAQLRASIPNEYIPKLYGGEGPDPDQTADAIVTRVAEQAAARDACGSEREFLEKIVEERKAGWTWEDALVDGFAP